MAKTRQRRSAQFPFQGALEALTSRHDCGTSGLQGKIGGTPQAVKQHQHAAGGIIHDEQREYRVRPLAISRQLCLNSSSQYGTLAY